MEDKGDVVVGEVDKSESEGGCEGTFCGGVCDGWEVVMDMFCGEVCDVRLAF